MKNLKVSLKLVVSFIIVIALTTVVGGVGIYGMMRINESSTEMYERQSVPLTDLAEARELFQRLRVQLRNIVLASGDINEINSIQDDVNSREQAFVRHMDAYRPTITDPSCVLILEDVMRAFGEYQQGMEGILAGARDNVDQAVLIGMVNDMRGPTDYVMNNLVTLMDARVAQGAELDQANDVMFINMLTIIIVVILIAVAIAIFLALYISSLISKPLNLLNAFLKKASETGDIALQAEDIAIVSKYGCIKDEIGQCISSAATFVKSINVVADELQMVSNGDLSIDVSIASDRDVLGLSLKKMVENLNSMFGQINSASSQVSSGSKQIADGAQSLAQGSTQQAASIEELSSSITEIAERTRANAVTADKTSKLSVTIKESAEKGNRQMDEMITAVSDINEASKSISKIIKTIDDIAFQTNILALNAAVEAARAGQHGKGFAVVAEEVRNLASKSAEAAKDTGNMIQNSMDKAELGSRIANETASSLAEIVSGINESSGLIAEIANASEAQSLGIEQINTGIDQVAQVVQQNSATAEESAAASEEMSGQSDALQQLIAQFRLKQGAMLSSFQSSDSFAQKRLGLPREVGVMQTSCAGDFGEY